MNSSSSQLVQQLRSSDLKSCLAAVKECLIQAASLSVEIVLAIVPLTAHSNEEIREQAVGVCESLESPPLGSAEGLAKLLPSCTRDAAYWCATLLGRLGADAAVAVNPLTDCLQHHEYAPARQRAAWALGQMGSKAAGASTALKQAAQSKDQHLSRTAQEALALTGSN